MVIFAEGDHHNPVPNAVRSVRLGRYKLICDRATGVEQLFDLESDPGERENVAEQHPEVVEALRRELERFESEAASGVELPELDPEEVEKLRALGYLQ